MGFQVIRGSGMESAIELARLNGINLDSLAKVIMLRDHQGFVMAACPVNRHLDLSRVFARTGRKLEIAAQAEYVHLFNGLDLDALPPLAKLYGLDMIIDDKFRQHPWVFLETGTQSALLKLSAEDFNLISAGAAWGDISEQIGQLMATLPKNKLEAAELHPGNLSWDPAQTPTPISYDDLDEVLTSLTLPLLLRDLLALQADGNLSTEAVVDLVSGDPEVAAVVIQFAQIPLFSSRTKVVTLRDAVGGLGGPVAAGLAAGLSLIRRYSLPTMGPLGQLSFWRQAIYCTAVLHVLNKKVQAVPHSSIFLGGLLHNFGFLLLGYLDPQRFTLLNEVLTRMPERNVHDVEAMMMGENHCRLGARLMQLWDMPDDVIVAVCEHHNEQYKGENAELANLILLSNRLLKRYGIGDARRVLIDKEFLANLDLDMEILDNVMQEVLDYCHQLDNLANQLALAGRH